MLSKDDYEKAIHLFFTNIEVNAHNKNILNLLKEAFVEIEAYLLTPKGYKPKTSENGSINNTQFAKKIQFCLKRLEMSKITFHINRNIIA